MGRSAGLSALPPSGTADGLPLGRGDRAAPAVLGGCRPSATSALPRGTRRPSAVARLGLCGGDSSRGDRRGTAVVTLTSDIESHSSRGPHPGGGRSSQPGGAGARRLPRLGRGGSRVLPPQVARGWRAAGTGGRPGRRSARSTGRPRAAGPPRSCCAAAATAAARPRPPGAAPAAAGSSSRRAWERGHAALGPSTHGRFPGPRPGPPRTVRLPARTGATRRHRG